MRRFARQLIVERLEDRNQPAIATFQASVGRQISATEPGTSFGPTAAIAASETKQGLLRFDQLVGVGPNKIPAGSTIQAASLTIWANTSAQPNDKIQLYRMIANWSEGSVSWSTFGGDGVQPNNIEASSASDGQLDVSRSSGFTIIPGLASTVQQWVDGLANKGWLIAMTGTATDWSFASGTNSISEYRPTLSVQYTSPSGDTNPSYSSLIGNPPSPMDSNWLTWKDSLFTTRLSRVPESRSITFYFSQAGSDLTGRGTADQPWKTLAKAQAVLDTSAGDIALRFRRGDVWTDENVLSIRTERVTIDAYGSDSLPAPLFSRFTRRFASDWLPVYGNLWKRAEPISIGWLRESANPLGTIYYKAAMPSEVESRPNSWYQDPSTGILYCNPGSGVNPNTLAGGLEACPNDGVGWYVNADNVRLQNFQIHGSGISTAGTGYGLMIFSAQKSREFVGRNLSVFYTGYHSIGLINNASFNLLEGCRVGLCANREGNGLPGSGDCTPIVDYSGSGGQEFLIRDSEITFGGLPSWDWAAQPGQKHGSAGIFQHANSGIYYPALSIADGIRNGTAPWGIAGGTWIGGRATIFLNDIRGYIFNDRTGPPCFGVSDRIYMNCSWSTRVGSSVGAAISGNQQSAWLLNCTIDTDWTDFQGYYGAGSRLFNTNTFAFNLRFENCRLNVFNVNAEYVDLLGSESRVGNLFSMRNTVISMTGSRPKSLGTLAVPGRLDHNAYFIDTINSPSYYSFDPAPVILSSNPPATPPTFQTPLYGTGATNGLQYDNRSYARDLVRADIGPVTGPPSSSSVQAVSVNAGQSQRSRVDRIGVSFRSVVSFAGPVAEAFQLARTGGGSIGGFRATASIVGGTTYVLLDQFSGSETTFASLNDGLYTLRILASQVSEGGIPLDGNGDGLPGGDYVLSGSLLNGLFRRYGDITGNGSVDGDDLSIFVTSVFNPANYIPGFDFDSNGSIDADELARFVGNLFVPL